MSTTPKKEELILLSVRPLSRKGGSLSITIPKEIVKILDLNVGNYIAFFYEKTSKKIIVEKVKPTYTTPSGLSFSISKRSAKKLLNEGQESE